MKEEFLHFVWRHKMFPMHNLKTTDGLPLQILLTGEYNRNAGPDFLNAQVQIGNTIWAGHIEMHLNATDWDNHHHSEDKAYENVILHVVYKNNGAITARNIPVFEIADYISKDHLDRYEKFRIAENWIPCQNSVSKVPQFTIEMWLERMLIERLEKKAEEIKVILERNKGDWSETSYQWMARSFGFSVNSMPFVHLAEQLPYKVIMKYSDNLFQLESLLFGVAGFLEEKYEDDYPNKLKKEYKFLAAKYDLKSILQTEWKLLRMRPDNFPCIRISQFASLMLLSDRVFSKLLSLKRMKEVYNFLDIKASEYWNNHYRFDIESEKHQIKFLGNSSKELFIINTLVPLIFAYGLINDRKKYVDQALILLSELKSEQNHIIRGWQDLGIHSNSAWHSQALIHLKKLYCDSKKCLECSIGVKIMNKAL
jgi:hypothetical protein